jgi:hypothetical protein
MISPMLTGRSVSNRQSADSGIWPGWSKSSGPTIKPSAVGYGRGDSPGRVTVAEAGRFGTRPLSIFTVANGSIVLGPNERGRRMVPHRPTASLDFRSPCSPQHSNRIG